MAKTNNTIILVGTRPNLMKIAPLIKEMKNHKEFRISLVHTGQHYDRNMSEIFFKELEIPEPDHHLGIGSGHHGEQVGNIMIRFEEMVLNESPHLLIVVGDVNSTLAGAIVAAKLHIKIAHIEAGLRSFNWNMPEEQNRVLTDRLADLLFIHSPDARTNLLNEGIDGKKIYDVGNIMIDSLIGFHQKAHRNSRIMGKMGLSPNCYCLLTLHRPSNVDVKANLQKLLNIFSEIQQRIPIVYPIHPRTKKNIEKYHLNDYLNKLDNFIITEPVGYLDFLVLMENAKFVMTDSGGIQEETTYLKVPCLTLRDETERPITNEIGTNMIVGSNKQLILDSVDSILKGDWKQSRIPDLWDGKTSERIVEILLNEMSKG
ncbi:UDP-N-acetylglucosamine 2-epimerase (non-hydrolyzing) [bacterium]|nr:UDP-N-acetylglucosamine 2-epimerase (non-hydrolyzing) [bacterium]